MKRSPIARKTPLVAKPAEPKLRTRKCEDCPVVMSRITTQPLPKRCSRCANARDNRLARERAAAAGRPKSLPPKMRRPKPLPSRNAKRRPTGSGSAQRELVMERAGGRCEFEILQAFFVYEGEQHAMTYPCGSTERVETAHIVRRHKCGDVAAHPDVVIAGCKHHHDIYDGRKSGIIARVSDEARERCFLAIRHAEVRRIFSGRACVPVDLSEILPAGEWTVDNQFALTDAARKAVAA